MSAEPPVLEDLNQIEQYFVKLLMEQDHKTYEEALKIYVNSSDDDISQFSAKLGAYAKSKKWIT